MPQICYPLQPSPLQPPFQQRPDRGPHPNLTGTTPDPPGGSPMQTPVVPAPAPTHPSAAPASASLLARYRAVRAASLALTAPLSPEDQMVQSCPEASPAK